MSVAPNAESMRQHLELLFSNSTEYSDGLIEIAYTDTHGAVNRAQYFSILDMDAAVDFAVATNSQNGINVYVGAAIRSPDTAPFGRSSMEDYYVSNVIWADLDDDGAAARAKDIYKALPPSMIVVTGRHPYVRAQAWWRSMNALDAAELRGLLSTACNALGGDKAVVDPARVMRLAGSIAYPHKAGRILELTELVVPHNSTKAVLPERFASYFPAHSPRLTPTGGEVSGDTPREFLTGRVKIIETLELTRNAGHWHVNMRAAVGAMIGQGWTDDAIRLACAPYCTGGVNDRDLAVLVNGGRRKWGKPDPSTDRSIIDPATGEVRGEQPKPRRMNILYADDITASTATNDFVEDVLCENQFSVIYGESNCGKTFFALDLSMHVATGKEWRGKAVEGGGVLYCALEGGNGTQNRIAAFKKHHALEGEIINLAVIPSNINFLSDDDMTELVSLVKESSERIGNIKLIVVDTLSRALSGADENSSADMGKIIIAADKLRAITSAHIAFIHHSGKDAARGARGHSSLRAAVDTEIEISRANPSAPSVIKIVKQREMEMIEEMAFKLDRVVLGTSKRGKEISSCVVVSFDGETAEKKTPRLTAVQTFVFDAIVACFMFVAQERYVLGYDTSINTITYDDLRIELEKRGFGEMVGTHKKSSDEVVKGATKAARIALKKHGKINFSSSLIWLV